MNAQDGKPVEQEPGAWDSVAEEYSRRAGECGDFNHRRYIFPAMVQAIGEIRGKSVLDLGCGHGNFTRVLANLGARVCGADASGKMIGIAQGIERRSPLGIEYKLCDSADLRPIRSGSYDIVTISMALQDMPDAKKTISECARVLRPGGRLVFSILHPIIDTHLGSGYKRDSEGYLVCFRRYLVPRQMTQVIFPSGSSPMLFHRPIGFYSKALFDNGLLIRNLEEIPLMHRPKGRKDRALDMIGRILRPGGAGAEKGQRSGSEDGLVELESGKEYEFRKELPFFLIVDAVKG
jgi:ubiquinone/menaquinone biosynthesis C-methylase UbiE